MSRTLKPNSRKAAEIMVRDYHKNIDLLRVAHEDALFSSVPKPEVQITGKGRTGDDTARRAGLLSTTEHRRKEEEVSAVQFAIGRCKLDKKQGEKILKIIDLVYWRGTHTMYGAAMEAEIGSPEWAGKLAGRFFRWVDLWFKID